MSDDVPTKDAFRVDEIFSSHAINSSRMLLVISATVALSKILDVQISQMQVLSKIDAASWKLDVVYVVVLAYLAFSHAVNWINDRAAAPEIFDYSGYFGDHQDSYGSGELTGFGWVGFFVNLRLHLGGAFGYVFWTPLLFLIWVKHLILPNAVCLIAVSLTLWSLGVDGNLEPQETN
jgi:hypothetical protein